jgi:hypothetical protein
VTPNYPTQTNPIVSLPPCPQHTTLVENQLDRRKLRTTKDLVASIARRARRNRLKAAGLCNVCGTEPVSNRVVCVDCADRNQRSNERSIFKKYGVELPWQLR